MAATEANAVTLAAISPHIIHPPAADGARRRGVVLLVCVGMFMTTLDASIVNIGLPSIARAFHTPLSGPIEWIIIGYLVVIAALLLSFGRLSDLVGRRPVWTAGLAVFTLGSALCGAAPSLPLLIAARALQGVGAALVLATSTAILTDAVPLTERGRALGWSAVAVSIGTTAGPTVGGLLTQYLSWRWIFYVNLPVGLGVIAATLRILPRTARGTQTHVDPQGALLLAVGIAALNLGLTFGGRWGWQSPQLLGSVALGVAALAGAVLVDRHKTDAVLDLQLFHNRGFVSPLVSQLLANLAVFAIAFVLPFYFEELRGFSTAHSGLLLTPFPVANAVVAPIAGATADRVGSRWLAPLGLAIVAFALVLLALVDTHTAIWDVSWRLALAGVGTAMFMSPNTRALMDAAPAAERGQASGLLGTARITGQSLSVASAGAVFTGLGAAAAGSTLFGLRAGGDRVLTNYLALQATFLRGFQAALLTCAVFATIGAIAALVRPRGQ